MVPLVSPPHGAAHLNAPYLLAPRPVADRTERDRHLDRPSALEPLGLDLPDRVPVPVRSSLVVDLVVSQRAESVRVECDGVAAVVEGVEEDPGVVVLADLGGVAAHLVRDDGIRALRVPDPGAHVEVLVVKSEPDLGELARRVPCVGDALYELRDRPGALVEGLLERSVHGHGLGDPGGANREARLPRLIDDGRRDRWRGPGALGGKGSAKTSLRGRRDAPRDLLGENSRGPEAEGGEEERDGRGVHFVSMARV